MVMSPDERADALSDVRERAAAALTAGGFENVEVIDGEILAHDPTGANNVALTIEFI